MLKFRNKIPRNTYFLQQAVFGFYFYYMGIFCAIQCGTSLSFLVANILCRIESGPISIIGYAFSIGNSIQIMLSYVLFVLRFSHPILQLRLRKIFGILRPSDEETDGNRNDEEENSWVGCLIESIKGSQILSFLSAITIGFI